MSTTIRIGHPDFRLITVPAEAARSRSRAIVAWRENNAPVPSPTVRNAVRSEMESLAGESLTEYEALLLALGAGRSRLGFSDEQTQAERKWLVHHFWDAIPEERRRGERPEPGEDF